MKTVLFSFIGMSDPIRFSTKDQVYTDGPLFQIVKNIMPDVVYYVRTGEVVKIDPENKIADALRLIKSDIVTHNLDYEDFDTPHIFGEFDENLEEIFERIVREYPASELYANFTSGTQQLITSLAVYASHFNIPIKKLQVHSPNNSSNNQEALKSVYAFTPLEMLEKSSDYNNVNPSRCVEFNDDSIEKKRVRSQIITAIKGFDYRIGNILYQEFKLLFPKAKLTDEFEKLEHLRKLDLIAAKKTKTTYLFPNFSDDIEINQLYYYFLYLKTLYLNDDLLEFGRGVSPIIDKILRATLRRVYKFNIEELCYLTKNNQHKISKKKLKYLDKFIPKEIQLNNMLSSENLLQVYGMVQTGKLINIIKALEKTEHSKGLDPNDFLELQEFERSIRNIAAHSITKILKEDILKLTKMTIDQFFKILEEFVVKLIGEDYPLDLYTDVNKYIADELEK